MARVSTGQSEQSSRCASGSYNRSGVGEAPAGKGEANHSSLCRAADDGQDVCHHRRRRFHLGGR
jgi:hypothetical protein